jgi:hypothetical protein
MLSGETPDELRVKIANYRQSRRAAARSLHRWLDALIADAEAQLHSLLAGDSRTTAPPRPASKLRPAAADHPHDFRST